MDLLTQTIQIQNEYKTERDNIKRQISNVNRQLNQNCRNLHTLTRYDINKPLIDERIRLLDESNKLFKNYNKFNDDIILCRQQCLTINDYFKRNTKYCICCCSIDNNNEIWLNIQIREDTDLQKEICKYFSDRNIDNFRFV